VISEVNKTDIEVIEIFIIQRRLEGIYEQGITICDFRSYKTDIEVIEINF
jgi:hypothetical protein